MRAAWLSCQWIGPSQGQLDPVKEINAEILACENGFSTREDSALRINGSDFTSNVEQLARESELLEGAGLAEETKEPKEEQAEEPEEDQEEEETEDEENTEQ